MVHICDYVLEQAAPPVLKVPAKHAAPPAYRTPAHELVIIKKRSATLADSTWQSLITGAGERAADTRTNETIEASTRSRPRATGTASGARNACGCRTGGAVRVGRTSYHAGREPTALLA